MNGSAFVREREGTSAQWRRVDAAGGAGSERKKTGKVHIFETVFFSSSQSVLCASVLWPHSVQVNSLDAESYLDLERHFGKFAEHLASVKIFRRFS